MEIEDFLEDFLGGFFVALPAVSLPKNPPKSASKSAPKSTHQNPRQKICTQNSSPKHPHQTWHPRFASKVVQNRVTKFSLQQKCDFVFKALGTLKLRIGAGAFFTNSSDFATSHVW